MAKIKKIAKAFDTNANGLYDLMGYTRQAVHSILKGQTKPKKERIAESIDILSCESFRIYIEDIKKAEARRQERAKFIEELRSKGGGTDE